MGQTSRRARSSAKPSLRADAFWSLVETSRVLQAPGGCPWDRKQTVATLLPCLVEEAWEVYEAVQRNHSADELEEELGDLLYTVVFMAMRGEQDGALSLRRMLDKTHNKMIRRHPHVFANRPAKTATEAYRNWQAIKRGEGKTRKGPTKRLSRLLLTLWSYLLQGKSSQIELSNLVRKVR